MTEDNPYALPDVSPDKLIQSLVNRLAVKEFELARAEALFALLSEENKTYKALLEDTKEKESLTK